MTHSGGQPHNVGDKGQRFEVYYYPNGTDEPKIYGWAATEVKAKLMLHGIDRWPAANGGFYIDREKCNDSKVED